MKLIKPSEISARILTLIEESNERVILVSPYMKISKWYKFLNKINDMKTRRIHLSIYVRDDPDNTATYRDLDQSALQYYRIPHLHSKLYLNERYGIVTSMNLLLSSEINSLEIGYETETWEEYYDMFAFYQRYIHIGNPVHFENIAGRPAADLNKLIGKIREELKTSAMHSWLWFFDNALYINSGRNNFIVSIHEGSLVIAGNLRLSSGENLNRIQNTSLIAKKIADLTGMRVFIHPGSEADLLQLSAKARKIMKSTSITALLETEAALLRESLIRFIDATDDPGI